ncbi:LANO_0F00254g1_1 [Lachancea nothofagi CBS 11611]|uniref:nitric oxide dioxygenase n=1 Tax=Lachancea nothofagi CBS 11611 TaxID=1266666 RepID=A0A1G4K575_9SACH|nr:LANO_0F00254g1_1 [Lachancea nothofagi CBS 11611]
MLSQETCDTVKATVGVLEQHGTTITSVFYHNMLSEHEELKNVFNDTNQTRGVQSTALAATVLAAAKSIENLETLLTQVVQIGHKHRALQVKPEHYPIVGKYLLGAIKEVLGDAASPEIMNAWAEAYDAIAKILISVEAGLYKEAKWDGWKAFVVTDREIEGENNVVFTVKPAKESGLDLGHISYVPGQYTTVKVHPTSNDALRHYSICSSTASKGLKFAVKRDINGRNKGLVSTYLFDRIRVGNQIMLSAPAGDFALDKKLIEQNDFPLVFLSSGIGATPLVAMMEQQVETNSARPLVWIQSSFNEKNQPFGSYVNALLRQCSKATSHAIHTETMPRISSETLSENIPSDADIYLCGSEKFVSDMLELLSKLGFSKDTIHYEPFGPKMAIPL